MNPSVMMLCLMLVLLVCSPVSVFSFFVPAFNGNVTTANWSPRAGAAYWMMGSVGFISGGTTTSLYTYTSESWTTGDVSIAGSWSTGFTNSPAVGDAVGLWFDPRGTSSVPPTHYLIGGRATGCADQSTIYSSTSTAAPFQWTSVATAPFGTRSEHAAVILRVPGVFTGVVLAGGVRCDVNYFNDVWISTNPADPTSWTLDSVDKSTPDRWLPRGYHSMVTITSSSTIVLLGGTALGRYAAVYNDVWLARATRPGNGTLLTWRQLTANAPWSARILNVVSTENDYLYLVGGSTYPSINPTTYYNEVWTSADFGSTWSVITKADSFIPRTSMMLFVLGRQITLFGGMTNPDYATTNDVWTVVTQPPYNSNSQEIATA